MKAIGAAILLTLLAGGVVAADQPRAPQDLAGAWTLSRMSEGPEVCHLTLSPDSTDGGLIVHIPFSCYKDFDVEDVTAWGVDPADGAILFNDRRGRPLYRFDPVPAGGYGANAPGWSLDRREAPPPRTPQQTMTGVWKMTGLGGRALCAFDLTSDARGLSGALRPREGCSGEWRGRGWTRWSLDGKELTLYGRERQVVVAFQRVDEVTFHKRDPIAEARGRTTDMLFFSREED